MAESFVLPGAVNYLATVSLTLGALMQTLVIVVSLYRYPRSLAKNSETVLELFILGNVLLCSALHVQAEEEFVSGLLSPPIYVALRLIVFVAVLLAVILVTALTRKPGMLPAILAAGLTLPFVESLAGYVFVFINFAVVAFFLIRSVYFGMSYYRENKSGLSALSVKNAIDSMVTGIMFCQRTGVVLLVNDQMQRLMKLITGKTQRNGRHFFSLLTLSEINPDCRITWVEGRTVIILPDGTAWQFTITELPIGRKTYIQLTATDITEQWRLAAELQPQNDALMQMRKELNETIANLNILSRERETQRAKMRTHDILGERLTLLQRSILGNKTPDYPLLRSLSQGLLDDLNTISGDSAYQDEILLLRQVFKAIGVEIEVSGNLPGDAARRGILMDITREAVTNAVRHGFATKVTISMENTGGEFRMTITDNGYPPFSIKEGGGISGMREKLRPVSGVLHVEISPQFALTAVLPMRNEG